MARTSLVMQKLGSSAMYDSLGNRQAVTLLYLAANTVVSHQSLSEGNYLVEVSIGEKKSIKKPQRIYLEKRNIANKGFLRKFKVNQKALPENNTTFGIDYFKEGQYIDVIGNTIGKGFAGVIKRHNFSGLRASHGVSISHRSQGSTGQNQDPGRVRKGKKMAGQLGNHRCTIQNLKVLKIDTDNNLLIVKGAVPGAKKSYIEVRDAIKKYS